MSKRKRLKSAGADSSRWRRVGCNAAWGRRLRDSRGGSGREARSIPGKESARAIRRLQRAAVDSPSISSGIVGAPHRGSLRRRGLHPRDRHDTGEDVGDLRLDLPRTRRNLKPSSVYCYLFIDPDSHGSRVGRTITAPGEQRFTPVKFALFQLPECQSGSAHAYRRMIYEDETCLVGERLEFLAGISEISSTKSSGIRKIDPRRVGSTCARYPALSARREIGRFACAHHARRLSQPYRAYLHDPDLQDARARWPFVCIWDNHEFSISAVQSCRRSMDRTGPRREKVAGEPSLVRIPARADS